MLGSTAKPRTRLATALATLVFTPPLADFIVSDGDRYIREQITSARFVGTTVVNGMTCSRVAFSGPFADGELWVSERQNLPCRFDVTARYVDGNPQIEVGFTGWNLNADLDDAMFTFVPPQGAERIRMVPRAELEERDLEP